MRNRWYHQKLGRFLQPDPIRYGDAMNMYAYVGGDPVNFTDPLGLKKENEDEDEDNNDITIWGLRGGGGGGGGGGAGGGWGSSSEDIVITGIRSAEPDEEIIVTGIRPPTVALAGIRPSHSPIIFAGSPRAPGERGAAGNSSGSADPYKNMKPHPMSQAMSLRSITKPGKR
jgi:hypothetical protein